MRNPFRDIDPVNAPGGAPPLRAHTACPLLSLALALTVISALPSAAAQGEEATDQLLLLEATWNEAHLTGDADALERLWDEELIVLVPGMLPMDRRESLAVARSRRMSFSRYETSGLEARLFGDAGVVTGRMLRRRGAGREARIDDWTFVKVYVRRPGGWRVVLFSATPTQ